ncbi:MAG: hypothetical protein PVJ21_10180 [Anaerolineales bacterium]|jgi:hypothetical protein
MNVLTRIFSWLYSQSLFLYPAKFRKDFGDEMEIVFNTAALSAAKNGWQSFFRCFWRELQDLPASILREHLKARRARLNTQEQFTPITPGELWTALIIFLIPALSTLLVKIVSIVNLDNIPHWVGIGMVIVFLGSLIVPLILAIIRGFPRWSPPYLGALLVIVTFYGPFWRVWGWIYPLVLGWFGSMGSWSLPVRILIQGMQAALIWLLVLLSVLILVSIFRLLPHTRTLWKRIRQDWTQFSFFLYGGLVVHIILIFDEYQHDEPWLIAAWLVLATGCWLYLRSRQQSQCIFILLGGATLAMWIVAAGKLYLVPLQNWGPWFERYPPNTERWFESGRTIADWLCLMIALLAPSMLILLPGKHKKISQEKPIHA